MFAAVDTFIALLVFAAIAIVSNWLKSRAGRDQGEGPPTPGQPGNWQEELRRMLTGEETPPPEEPPPPPVIRTPPPVRPTPAQPVIQPAEPRRVPAEERGLAVNFPSVTHATGTHPCARDMDERVGGMLRQRNSLAEAATAFLHGRQIESRVAEHMRRVTEETPAFLLDLTPRATPRPEVTQAREILRHAATARAAILTSVILGPPKALEE